MGISRHFEFDQLAEGALWFSMVYDLDTELGQADVALHHVLVAKDGPQREVAYSEFGLALVALGRGQAEGKVGSASSTVIAVVMGVVLLSCLA